MGREAIRVPLGRSPRNHRGEMVGTAVLWARGRLMTVRRLCAIYTRKSTSEGLEQDFNSLDAQREACAAYIKSQRHEGWTPVRSRYDDGGLSGATMERPALARLLDDIRGRRVDVVVVYKVDRLTRALSDFAKMVEVFDAHGVSFVSVTQQFNTTSSMGRLTLNVLLSFAQFEREVTAERIRDKIAASKRKGMWMGGVVPLGYDVVERRLLPNVTEAKTVREIFVLYAELGTVEAVKQEADRRGLRTKPRGDRAGQPFTRGHLYKLLGNPIYVGRIRHGSATYPGEHEPIIDLGLWERVQGCLRANAGRRKGPNGRLASLLGGIVFTDTGQRLVPSYANGRTRRYYYYVSQDGGGSAERAEKQLRLRAADLERAVVDALVCALRDEAALSRTLMESGVLAGRSVQQAVRRARDLADQLLQDDEAVRREAIVRCVERIEIGADTARFAIREVLFASEEEVEKQRRVQAGEAGTGGNILLAVPISCPGRGHGHRTILSGTKSAGAGPDPKLIRAVTEGHSWYERLRSGEVPTVRELAESVGRDRPDVGRRLRLAFLAPDIVSSIVDGEQPASVTIGALLRQQEIPLSWAEQRRLFGFPDPRASDRDLANPDTDRRGRSRASCSASHRTDHLLQA